MFDFSLVNSGLAFLPNIGTPEVLLFLGLMALLFGSAKLPALMRNMGRSVNEFKAGMKDKPNEVIESEEEDQERLVKK